MINNQTIIKSDININNLLIKFIQVSASLEILKTNKYILCLFINGGGYYSYYIGKIEEGNLTQILSSGTDIKIQFTNTTLFVTGSSSTSSAYLMGCLITL